MPSKKLRMNSEVIKFVAGAGKTYRSMEYLRANSNGLYLAFTNSVVDDLSYGGAISRTIDAIFTGFLFPKTFPVIPIIRRGSELQYLNTADVTNPVLKNIGKIHIDKNGDIYSGNKLLPVSLNTPNAMLHNMAYFPNLPTLKAIFGRCQTLVSDSLREDLMTYLITKYPKQLIYFIKTRFDYVIFDESQDLGGSKEAFAKLLYHSDIPTIFLGDENQRIMPNSGNWFQEIKATEIQNLSRRCPEANCKWIRENLGIDIYGDTRKVGSVENVRLEDVKELDDGRRVLLYQSKRGKLTNLIESWSGPKSTIGSIKGSTIDCDIVIAGKSLNRRSYYVALSRTTKIAYTMIEKINE